MKKSTRLLVVHLSIMSLLHSLGACQVPKMGIFSFHFMCLPSIHHIMLSCFYRIFRISTVQCEIVNQFFFSKKTKIPYVYVHSLLISIWALEIRGLCILFKYLSNC